MHRHYIFTDKRESKKGILSAMLGAMSLISVFLTVYFTWQNHGTAYVRYGVVALLCLIFSAAGLVLGIMAKVAPQMNMFSVGMQLKVLVGFVVIFLTIFLLPDVANMILKEIKTMVKLIAEGMY